MNIDTSPNLVTTHLYLQHKVVLEERYLT